MAGYPLIFIIVPHWNAGGRTLRCLQQFRRWSYPLDRINIFVQDNASSDGSSDALKSGVEALVNEGLSIRYNRLPAHPGLTQSINMALSQCPADAKYVMRLDNDVELSHEATAAMVQYLEFQTHVGILGPRIVYASDPSRLNAGAIWLNRWGGKNKMEDASAPVACDTLLGAVMLARLSALEKVGRWFDPKLYLFAEENEICWQLRRFGLESHYLPSALAYHDTAQSTGRHSSLSTYLNYRNHVLVANQMTSIPVSVVRNLNLALRIPVRCLRERSWVALYGFWDGLIKRPLNNCWWEQQISSPTFRRP